MATNLIVYYYKNEYPPRASVTEHLYSFQNYSNHNSIYLNIAVRSVPRYLENIQIDLVIFHTLFFSARWDRSHFSEVIKSVTPLKDLGGVKVAIPQDEFLNTDLLVDFINEFNIDWVFSVAPESEWEKIYPSVDRTRVKFVKVLTGYLDEKTLGNISSLAQSVESRPIDVGYRAWRGAAWLGRHGFLKAQIADVFQERGPAAGLITDVSTRAQDTLLGDAWYEFLLRCKYIIGVEGGASILDYDGSIRETTEAYVKAHPDAGFDEIEANCFPTKDGSLRLFAISPRHLEACATRTCQVLVDGEYNGILLPGKHYIELQRDFSNLDCVLQTLKQDSARDEIVEKAYQDIVASQLYTYRSFVKTIIEHSLGFGAEADPRKPSFQVWLASNQMRLTEKLSWIFVMVHWYFILPAKRYIRQKIASIFSERVVLSWRQRLKRKREV